MVKDGRNLIVLKNDVAEVIIDPLGAQLISYKIKGVEIMYQGAANPETAQWAFSSKNCFPAVGPVEPTQRIPGSRKKKKLKQETYIINGKEVKQTIIEHNGAPYHVGQHGFAQYKIFTLRGKTADGCVLSIRDDDWTTNEYPYKFTYYVMYSLDENGLLHYETVAQNNDNKDMVAGMGWHPAFALHDDPSKYKVVFKNLKLKPKAKHSRKRKMKDITAQDKVVKRKKNSDVVEIEEPIREDYEYDIFSEVIKHDFSQKYRGIESADVVIMYETEDGTKIPYLTMHTNEDVLLLWSKKVKKAGQENFICLEPWNCYPAYLNDLSTQDKTSKLSRRGAIVIKPGEKSVLTSSVLISPEYIEYIAEQIQKKANCTTNV